jgi:hypothetical protein
MTRGLKRPSHGNFKTIRVAVQARAFPRMMRKHVRRLKFERFPNDHDLVAFCIQVGCSGFRTPALLGTARNFIGFDSR